MYNSFTAQQSKSHCPDLDSVRLIRLPCAFVRALRLLCTFVRPLKVGFHTESRCQYQPASFSSAFKLSGTACLVGVGGGGGGSHPHIWDM